MEKEIKLEVYQVRLFCDSCKNGEMISGNYGVSNSSGSSWNHYCNECGVSISVKGDPYPRLRYKESK